MCVCLKFVWEGNLCVYCMLEGGTEDPEGVCVCVHISHYVVVMVGNTILLSSCDHGEELNISQAMHDLT